MTDDSAQQVHEGQSVLTGGAAPEEAKAAAILLHGRGATAQDIMSLAAELGRDDVAYLAPQARGGSWYPLSFLAPIDANEPGLSSALRVLGRLCDRVAKADIPPERTLLLGFSQGACLTLEFAARNARRYGGIVALTGGLIGPPGAPRDYPGEFQGTPVLLGSSIPDPHVPWERVEETARVFERCGATVDLRGYPGMPHTVNGEELELARAMLNRIADD